MGYPFAIAAVGVMLFFGGRAIVHGVSKGVHAVGHVLHHPKKQPVKPQPPVTEPGKGTNGAA